MIIPPPFPPQTRTHTPTHTLLRDPHANICFISCWEVVVNWNKMTLKVQRPTCILNWLDQQDASPFVMYIHTLLVFSRTSCRPCSCCSSSYPPLWRPPLHLSTLLFLFVSAGAEATSLQGPFSTDWHAPLLCRPVGHPEQSLSAMSNGASPGCLLTGPVHGPLWCSYQTAVCHRLNLSAPRK